MKKSELESGMVLETDKGRRAIVVGNTILYSDGKSFDTLKNIDENLNATSEHAPSINKVFEYKNKKVLSLRTSEWDRHLNLLWDRYQNPVSDPIYRSNDSWLSQSVALEDQCIKLLQHLETLSSQGVDTRCINIAKTQIQQGFMWVNKSLFNGGRNYE